MVLFRLSNFGWMQVASFILSWIVVGFFNMFMLESDEKVSILCMFLFPLFQTKALKQSVFAKTHKGKFAKYASIGDTVC